MTLQGWLAVTAVCALGAISPGPSLAVVVRHALQARTQGVACAFAHALGVGLYAVATVLGMGAVLIGYPLAHQALVIAGALYLLWLGIAGLCADGDGESSPGRLRRDWRGALRDGFAIALLNPKVAIFFLALFSQFVQPGTGLRDTVILSLTAMGIDGLWYLLVALTLSSTAVLGLERHRRTIDRTMALVLIAVAGWTLTRIVVGAV